MKLTLFVIFMFINSVAYSSDLFFTKVDNTVDAPISFIKNIHQGKDGFMWVTTTSQVLRFDGYEFKKIQELYDFPDPNIDESLFNAFLNSSSGDVWVGTKDNGVFAVINKKHYHFNHNENNPYKIDSDLIHGFHEDSSGNIWIATNKGINRVYFKNLKPIITSFNYPFAESRLIKKMISFKKDQFLIASKTALLSFDPKSNQFENLKPVHPLTDAYIWDIHQDFEENLWLSNDDGLFKKKENQFNWVKIQPKKLEKYIIKSITSDPNNIWLGTAINGLLKISKVSQEIKRYESITDDRSSLTTNDITRVYYDEKGLLWVTGFDGSINIGDLNSHQFGLNKGVRNNKNCFTSSVTYHFNEDDLNNLYIVTQNEVVKIKKNGTSCQRFQLNSTTNVYPLSSGFDNSGNLWISSNQGLHLINQVSPTKTKQFPLEGKEIQFIIDIFPDFLLLGTDSGLYKFSLKENNYQKVDSRYPELINTKFNDFIQIDEKSILLATDQGLAIYKMNQLGLFESIQNLLLTKKINAIQKDHQDQLWIGTEGYGLFKINLITNEITTFTDFQELPENAIIRSLLLDQNNHLWISTETGLFRYKPQDNTVHLFNLSDGLQDNLFNIRSKLLTKNGLIYWGGRKGFNAFDPNQIELNLAPPKIAFTSLSRFNKTVTPNVNYDGFKILQPINKLTDLTLSHKDYVIGFEFAALDYADSSRNQYAYQLEEFDPDWNYVDASDRNATYTNLPRGDYTFRVKASNKDGIWNKQGKSLQIQVLPAPWLSWWAISLYVLSVLFAAYVLINRKLQANQRLANLLRIEVKEKTKELQLQKQTVESLLAKKNELFSNVSHEFRTPLTLILGPITQLIEESQHHQGHDALKMIKRNANRLLSLVEQLLQLAKSANFEQPRLVPQRTDQQIFAIVDSFQHLAQKKKIELALLHNDAATINATEQSLDAILGNLLSNAIKYTKHGGQVIVSSTLQDNTLTLSVKDNGAGIGKHQQSEVFNRFKRLDEHLEIEGIGIGLSVVEELVDINHGKISLVSALGEGSEFIVTLPGSEITTATSPQHQSTLVKQLTQETEAEGLTQINNVLENNNKEVVLIIEDNHDMRNHIVSVLQSEYHCLQAQNGKVGVANAIKYVPDLIVCDVMMPEMDGFKVSRVIRSDQRTSHIPLILLTALDDRENRIKGWRENIDVYMTKPFDRLELLVQVENIITIRSILKKKAHLKIANNQTSRHSGLPKKDFEFVDKLIQTIKNNYQNTQLNRDKIASKMAVSDRQLQRKIKALIDQNPMDMLREYRLKKAAEKLKDGYQVALSSDAVGFKTPAHFSQCFKAQYGLTPKQYQQQFTKKSSG